jgi:O-antigen ligase
MWIRSLWIFNDASLFEKLFGVGPDMFYSAFKPYFADLMHYGDSSTNAAHNEYLNYLVTVGLLGLGAYLVAIGSSIRNAVKSFCKHPLAIVCISAVICYSAQAIVNIAQPITTPLLILFIALTEAVYRKSKV